MLELETWRVLPITLSVPFQLAFVMLYSMPRFGAGEWWRDFTGRALFYKSAALLVLLVLSTISITLLVLSGGATLVWDISSDSTYRQLPNPYGIVLAVIDLIAAVFYWVLLFTIMYQLGALFHERRYVTRIRNMLTRKKEK